MYKIRRNVKEILTKVTLARVLPKLSPNSDFLIKRKTKNKFVYEENT